MTRSASGSSVQLRNAGIEPDVAPVVERDVRIVVVTRQSLAQVRRLEAFAGLANRLERHVLDDDVRRHEDETAYRARCRVDQPDRRAVTVSDENGLVRVEQAEDLRKDDERLLVEERRRTRCGRWIRPPMPEPREDDDTARGRALQRFRESPPGADRPEPLVQENEWALVRGPGKLGSLEASAVDLEVERDPRAHVTSPRSALRRRRDSGGSRAHTSPCTARGARPSRSPRATGGRARR